MTFHILRASNCIRLNHGFGKSNQDVFSYKKETGVRYLQWVMVFPMKKFRNIIDLAIWALAAAFAAFRIGTSDAFIVGMIEGLMVLIVAFVAHKTLDLLIMTASKKEDE